MREIPLTKGQVALVDDADYEWLSRWEWHAWKAPRSRVYYAVRETLQNDGKRCVIYLHRFVLGALAGDIIDHKNCDGLDCQRENLRRATMAQNAQNARKARTNTSGYKGVSFSRRAGLFEAYISYSGKRIRVGYFRTAEEAGERVAAVRAELHGEFARDQ